MASMIYVLTFLLQISLTIAQSATLATTTVKPVFAEPVDTITTVYQNTVTTTSALDCSGSSLEVLTFGATITTTGETTTVTSPTTTSTSYVCETSTATTATVSTISLSVSQPTPTASPLPPIEPEAQILINRLATALLYAQLIANDGDLVKLCSAVSPSNLDAITNPSINGSAVQNEICASASLSIFAPNFIPTLVKTNAISVTFVAAALFAVQVAGGFAGGTDLATLCSEIDAHLLDNIFIASGFEGTGTVVKDFVCGAAGVGNSTSKTRRRI